MTLTRQPPGGQTDEHGLAPGLEGLREVMRRLLAEDGCPWDREQTLETLRPYLIEECHEVLDAMNEPEAHRDELGDLLFQIVFQSALREAEGAFDLDDVVAGIRTKLVRRHPHVFGAPSERASARNPAEVAAQWERIKAEERAAKGGAGKRSGFEGIPGSLPGLARAAAVQSRAAKVGFDWPDVAGARAKVGEELDELDQAVRDESDARVREEFGDLLFAIVRLGQKLGLEPESALRDATRKFEKRFGAVLEACAADGIAPEDAGLERLDAYWNATKTEPSS